DIARRVTDPRSSRALADFAASHVHAVAAIGNPDNFFDALRRRGVRLIPHAFPDHHPFRPADFAFGDGAPVLMTQKDAVKCEHFADDRFWYVPLEVELPDVFERRLKTLLKKVIDGQEAA
ncbi:MAG: tetraacyldisaccharide 4'-kinase, partial [Gammaproteobacteria bacterium]